MSSIEQIEKPKNNFSFGQNGLFTVGLDIWKDLYEYEKCGINEMVVFLSLSCGTDETHIKSTWSINSVKKYIGLTEIPAKKALKNLIDTGFVKVIKPVLKVGDRPEWEVEHCPKLNERGTWIIMRPLWDMQLIEPVFFVTDSPDEAPNDEKVFMYELFTEEQKAIADKILSGRYNLDESLSKQLNHVSKCGKFTSNIAFGFIDCDYANASIKPMFRLKYRTKNPYSKTRIRDQGKFERELTQKAEKHI